MLKGIWRSARCSDEVADCYTFEQRLAAAHTFDANFEDAKPLDVKLSMQTLSMLKHTLATFNNWGID